MNKNKNINQQDEEKEPLFGLYLSDEDLDTGVQFLSLVNHGANKAQLVYYADEDETTPQKLFYNEEKQTVVCPVLFPGQKIKQKVKSGKLKGKVYYHTIDEEEIRESLIRFSELGYNTNIDLQHNEKPVKGCVSFQNWLVGSDPTKDKAYSDYGYDTVPGTWMTEIQIKDTEFFNKYVKSGKVKGLSIGGSYLLKKLADDISEVQQSDNVENEKENSNLFTEYINDFAMNIKKLFTSKQSVKQEDSSDKYTEAKTTDNTIVRCKGDYITTGVQLEVVSEDGTSSIAADGEYELQAQEYTYTSIDQKKLTVEKGLITNINTMSTSTNKSGEANEAESKPVTQADEAATTDTAKDETLNKILDAITALTTKIDSLSKTEKDEEKEKVEQADAEAKRIDELNKTIAEMQKELETIGKKAAPSTKIGFSEPAQNDRPLTTAEKYAKRALNSVKQ